MNVNMKMNMGRCNDAKIDGFSRLCQFQNSVVAREILVLLAKCSVCSAHVSPWYTLHEWPAADVRQKTHSLNMLVSGSALWLHLHKALVVLEHASSLVVVTSRWVGAMGNEATDGLTSRQGYCHRSWGNVAVIHQAKKDRRRRTRKEPSQPPNQHGKTEINPHRLRASR